MLTVFGLLSLFLRAPYLVLTNAVTNQVLFITRLYEGETFSISHIHSLNQSPVREIYEIRDGQIVLISLEFETVGAGMPEGLEPGQTLARLETGGLRIDGFERAMTDLHLLIGHTAQHTLHIGDLSIPLDTLDRGGQSVQFSSRPLHIWQRLYFKR